MIKRLAIVAGLTLLAAGVALAQDVAAVPTDDIMTSIGYGGITTVALTVVVALQNAGILGTAKQRGATAAEAVASPPARPSLSPEQAESILTLLREIAETSKDSRRILREPDRNGIGVEGLRSDMRGVSDSMVSATAAIQAHTSAIIDARRSER